MLIFTNLVPEKRSSLINSVVSGLKHTKFLKDIA